MTSDAEILEVVMKSAVSIDHAACTCAMGRATDPNAVVDAKARVLGVGRLRVVDASAFPFLPPGHPQGTVCTFDRAPQGYDCDTNKGTLDALAEKIADDILRGL